MLLSGGLDSTTVLAIAKDQGFEPYALSFRYGQRHAVELEAARSASRRPLGSRGTSCATSTFGSSGALRLTADVEVPKHDSADDIADDEIPITYVPARNTIFLSFALAYAEVVGATDIFIGVSALDYSGYPDCRPEYIAAYEQMANLATRAGVEGNAAEDPHAADRPDQGRDRRTRAAARRRLLADVVVLRPRRPRAAPAATATPACCGSRASRTRASPTRSTYQDATA